VRDLVTGDSGVIVMASSTCREFSLENNALRQSNFTLAIVNDSPEPARQSAQPRYSTECRQTALAQF